MNNYEDIIKTVLTEHDNDFIHYGEDTDGHDFLIVQDWQDVKELNNLIGQELVKLGEVTQQDFEEKSQEQYNTTFLDTVIQYWGFSDSYIVCDYCGKIVPTEDNSYIKNIIITNCEVMCSDCARENQEIYIDYLLEEDTDRPKLNIFLDESELIKQGFTKLPEGYESGYYGKWDDPNKVKEQLKSKYRDIIFSSEGIGQFATYWSVFVRGKI